MRRTRRLVLALVLGAGTLAMMATVFRLGSLEAAGVTVLPGAEMLDATERGGSPIGSSFPISPSPGVNAVRPAVAYNSQRNEYLTVWWNERAGSDDIYGRRLTRDGELLPWFAIAWGPKERRQPAVAYNSQDDEYLVVYTEDWDIAGSRLPAIGGTPNFRFLFTTHGISSTVYYDLPAIAYNPTQNVYLLAFRYVNENWQGSYGSKVEAVGVLGDGSGTASGNFSIDDFSTSTRPGYPDVVYNPSRDEFLVVWQRREGTDWNIHGQRVGYDPATNTMQKKGGSFPILSTSIDEYNPAVAAIPRGSEGEYMVVSVAAGDGAWKLVGRRVTGLGALQGTVIDVSVEPGVYESPDVASSPAGERYHVVWTLGHALIHERAVSAEGELLGEEVTMGSSLTLARSAAVVGGPLADFFVAFQDASPTGFDYDIYGHLWGIRRHLPLVLR